MQIEQVKKKLTQSKYNYLIVDGIMQDLPKVERDSSV